MIHIIDYGIGNLRSIEKAFEAVGADVNRSDRAADIAQADKLVLPGVGAFGACADELRRRALVRPILDAVEAGTPLLGVCVGMQLLFEYSEELGRHEGLGLLRGRVVEFQNAYALAGTGSEGGVAGESTVERLKVPHMGWNTIQATRPGHPLFDGLPAAPYFYFVHSFHAAPENPGDILAATHYGIDFPAVVQREHVYGVQFHPEKSQHNGLRILRNYSAL